MAVKSYSLLALGLYIVLSVVDYIFTFALIQLSGGLAYESNPVAAAFLNHHGWYGLAAFKAAGVLVFVGTVGVLTIRRRWVGAAVATFGCAVLFSVVSYSNKLIAETRHEIATRNAGWGPPPPDPLKEPYLGLLAKR
ncbi:MAG TPA: DUF5658 family protein [Urbifossiella sp.]|jgi:hypothetical protein